MALSWDLIVWKNENAIDFVPSVWANADGCSYKYPCGLSDRTRRSLIYQCQDISENFIWCEAIVKKASIKYLEKAKELCKRGQDTSTLETTDASDSEPQLQLSKRKRTHKRVIEDEGEQEVCDNNDDKNGGIKEKHASKKKHKISTDQMKTFQVPRVARSCSPLSGTRSVAVEDNMDDDSTSDTESLPTTVTVSRNTSCSNISSNKGSKLSSSGSMSSKQYAQLLFLVKENNNKLNNLENRILATIAAKVVDPVEDFGTSFSLPATSVEELNSLNETIQVNNKKMAEFIHILFLLGGDDAHRSVFLMMGKVISKELAPQYSGIGKKKKLSFSNLKFICEGITAAIRKRFSNATDQEIKRSIAIYLSSAKSRLPK